MIVVLLFALLAIIAVLLLIVNAVILHKAKKDKIDSQLIKLVQSLYFQTLAGKEAYKSWETASEDTSLEGFNQVALTQRELDEGVSVSDAYSNFAKRCNNNEQAVSLSFAMIQSIEQSHEDLDIKLQKILKTLNQNKLARHKVKGGEINSELQVLNGILFAIVLAFIGAIIALGLLGTLDDMPFMQSNQRVSVPYAETIYYD